MRITHISRYKVAKVMVRGFFHAFITGQKDALYPGVKSVEPKIYKQITADNYETLSARFVSTLFPVLIRLNFTDPEAVAEDMKARHFSNTTSPKLLLRYACASKSLYDEVIAEYQAQMSTLLQGKLQPIDEFFSAYKEDEEMLDKVDVPLAIRSMVRVQMLAYSSGMMAAKTDIKSLFQASIYKLMIYGMMALMSDEVVELEGDNLEMIFRKVSQNSENFELLMNEMTQAYQDLV